MQLAAFLCVICVICGRIFTQEYSIYHQRNPMYLPQISQTIADKTRNTKPQLQTVFLCEIMQQSCIPLRNLRYLRENNTQEYSIYIAPNETTVSLADHADNRSRNNNNDSWRNPIYFYRLFTFRYIALLILSALKFTSIPKRLLASLR